MSRSKQDLRSYMAESGNWLPRPLRDFHNQKDVFKQIFRRIREDAEKDPRIRPYYSGEFTWVMAQCFVIDRFLWFMASHGYTLQKTRGKPFEFCDLDATMAEFRREELDAVGKVLREGFERKAGG